MICVPTLGDEKQLYILAFTIFLSQSRDVMSPTHKNSGECVCVCVYESDRCQLALIDEII